MNLQIGAAGDTNPATVANIETFNIIAAFGATGAGAGGDTIDITNFSGLKTVNISGTGSAAGALTVLDFTDGGASLNSALTGLTTIDASGITAGTLGVTASFNLTTTAAVTLKGGAGVDTLTGGSRADTIVGGAGNDTLDGGAGNDTITGGIGQDNLTGGLGADTFVFNAVTESRATNAGADTITDFVTGQDVIKSTVAATSSNYSELAAFVGVANDVAEALAVAEVSFAAAGTAQYLFINNGADGFLFLDSNGDGTADMGIILAGITNAGIAAGDIIA